jgi:hypothetical protein
MYIGERSLSKMTKISLLSLPGINKGNSASVKSPDIAGDNCGSFYQGDGRDHAVHGHERPELRERGLRDTVPL